MLLLRKCDGGSDHITAIAYNQTAAHLPRAPETACVCGTDRLRRQNAFKLQGGIRNAQALNDVSFEVDHVSWQVARCGLRCGISRFTYRPNPRPTHCLGSR